MLSQPYRFHGHGSLHYVYKHGRVVRSSAVTLKVSRNPRRPRGRYAVVISKKTLKSAVGRNRIRRRVYEVLRRQLPLLQPGHDVVVMVFSAELATMPHTMLEQLLQQLLKQAKLYK